MFMKAERQTGPSALGRGTQRHRLEVTSVRSETGWLGMLTRGDFFLWMKSYLRVFSKGKMDEWNQVWRCCANHEGMSIDGVRTEGAQSKWVEGWAREKGESQMTEVWRTMGESVKFTNSGCAGEGTHIYRCLCKKWGDSK